MQSVRTVRHLPPLAAACALLLAASAASAQGIGFQSGLTLNPEQIYVGTHVELPLGSDQLILRPAIDGGFGSDLRVAAIGAEIQYRVDLGNSGWRLSQGFGPGVYIARFANGFEGEETTDLSGAWTYAFGLVHEGGFFTELKGGGSRSFVIPTLRIGVGFTIRPERP
jgi:hypothetical protein